MSQFPTLSRPPIVEALIDCRLVPTADVSVELLRSKVEALRRNSEVLEERRHFAAEFSVASDGRRPSATSQVDVSAFVLRDEASGRVRQFRRDGFTVSFLKDYSRWEQLEAEAVSALGSATEWCSPSAISRLATRFINVLPLSESTGDLDKLLTVGPKLPGTAFSHVREFSYRTVMGTEDENISGILNLGTYRTAPGQSVGLLVDVDVFTIEQLGVDEGEFSRVLAQLRGLKNSIFFGAVTAFALEPFQ